MLKYIKGLSRLRRIRFNIKACQDIYYLKATLQLFLQAEGKQVQERGGEQKVLHHPMVRRLVVSRLPQLSEALHERILELRAMHDSKLSTKRVIKPRPELHSLKPGLLSLEKDAFFRNNEALFLTYPKAMSGAEIEDIEVYA